MKHGAAEKFLIRTCAGLGPYVPHHEPFPVKPARGEDPYPSLVRAVVFQQLSGKAATTIFNRVLALFPRSDFPTPASLMRMDEERLRAAGLSWAKIAAVKDIAKKRVSGIIPDADAIRAMDDEEIVARLTQARGVGRWTVQMHLIFAMGRPDVLPIDDLAVRKGAERIFERDFTPKQLDAFGERWKPWRSAAAWHLWRVMDTKTV
jgi:3-methyladenine DNA glycosylase/8-oxoguanine DNA glycosylase